MRSTILATLLLMPTFSLAQERTEVIKFTELAGYTVPLLDANKAAEGKGHAYIRIQFGNRDPERVLVDTGSVGLILPAEELGHPAGTPGTIRYSSSGIGYKGVWTKMRINIPDAKPVTRSDEAVLGMKRGASAEIEVFSAEERTCDEGTPHSNCANVMKQPISVHMLGIGYGRSAKFATPDKNLFLQLDEMKEGKLPRVYGFRDNKEVAFGSILLPIFNPNNHCQFQKLKPFSARDGDWQTPTATIKIDGKVFEGTVLFDTGIEDVLLAADTFPTSGNVAGGTKVEWQLDGTMFGLSFTVGAGKMPSGAHWVKPTHGAYINTGYTPLLHFDYIYNASAGEAGFCGPVL